MTFPGPLARDADLSRLLDDGYSVVIQGGHLVIHHIPYVTTEGTVEFGFLTYPVTVSGDKIVTDTDHRIWFGGAAPCNQDGRPLTLANPEERVVSEQLVASFMLSSKPPNGYPDQYEKITAYVRILSHPAAAVDNTITATPGPAWQEVEDDLPFVYRDTASSRAGLAAINKVFNNQHVAHIGLGGSGGYILDQVAKTQVPRISLFDGDFFDNHNAFRAPGAADIEDLKRRPNKAAYFAAMYSRMHTGITAHSSYLTEDNLHLLDDITFAFVAMDDAAAKATVIAYLSARNVGLIDVGMGVEEIDGKLTGLLRITVGLPGAEPAKISDRIPAPAEDRDDYARNIQVADLNALNALLAVIRWKRHIGFYADGTNETFSTYSIFTNDITNEDI